MEFLGRASSASPVSFHSHIPLRNAASILKSSHQHVFSVCIDAGRLFSPVGYPNQGGSHDRAI